MNIQQNIKDYTTLTKPKVNLLLVITALSAIFLASNNLPSIQVLVAVVVGGTLASGGAGAINHSIDKDIDNIELLRRKKKYDSTSVNENREIDKVYGDFEVLLRDFEKEFISLSAQAGRANDNKADERIMIKTLKKHLPPLYSMVRSWKRSSKRD